MVTETPQPGEFIDYGLEYRYARGGTKYGSDCAGTAPGWYASLITGMSDDGPKGPFRTKRAAIKHLQRRFAAEFVPAIRLVLRGTRLYRRVRD